VSHQTERKEKNCLNCGATVIGRYCHVCGQENIVIKQSFWSLNKHFVYDIFHFDGKFFETLGHLIWRPGIISKEYVEGKRTKYLDPIRMYLFTSAFFFLVFFAIGGHINIGKEQEVFLTKPKRMEVAYEVSEQLKRKPDDSILKKQLNLLLDSTYRIELDSAEVKNEPVDSLLFLKGRAYRMRVTPFENTALVNVKSKNGWVSRKIENKVNDLHNKYGENLYEGIEKLIENGLHKLPYLLFVSLPFFAGILKLLYIRRKNFYYSDHAVFTLHHYILSFILMLLIFVFGALEDKTGWRGVWNTLTVIVFWLWPIYLFIEMKRFYGQGWIKTLGKFLLLNILGIITLFILALIFLLFSVFQI
jgi:hypothetical protein